MKRFSGLAAVTLLALATASCVTMSVASHLDRGADFTQYRTWDWGAPDNLPTGDPRLDHNPFFVDHLTGAIEKTLARRGFTRTDESVKPDLLFHYHANISQRFEVNEAVDCVPGDCTAQTRDYEQGTLVVDAIDARTSRLVWRAWAQDSVQGVIDNQDRLERQVDEAVGKMFAQFPRGF